MIFDLQNIIYIILIFVVISFSAFEIKKGEKHRFLYYAGLITICFYWIMFVYIGVKNEFSIDLFMKFIIGFLLMTFILQEQATTNPKSKIVYRIVWFSALALMLLFRPM